MFAAIMFSIMSYSVVSFYNGMTNAYTVSDPANFNYDYEGISAETKTVANETTAGIAASLSNWVSALPGVGTVYSELKIAGSVLYGLLHATDVMTSMVTGLLSNIPNMPQFIVNNIQAAVALAVSLAVLAWLMRSEG